MTLTHRLATPEDMPALTALMDLAIGALQRGFLSDAQIAASRKLMGLDSQLIADRTYFVVEDDGRPRRLRRLERPGDPLRRRSRPQPRRHPQPGQRRGEGAGDVHPSRLHPGGAWAG